MNVLEPWTEPRVELLKQLWKDGHSCSVIASMLGKTTRNAVIGKVHRLHLDGRRTAFVSPRISRAVRKRVAVKRMKLKRPPPAPRQVEPDIASEPFAFTASAWQPLVGSSPVTLEHVTGCKWVVSDPFLPPFSKDLFCNCAVMPGKSWCPEHHARSVGKGTPSERVAVKAVETAVRYERNRRMTEAA